MSRPEGWPENVEYYNSILYQRWVDRVAEFKLPELQLSNLEVFRVPRGHPAYPGRGARVRDNVIKKGEDVAYYAGFYRPAMVAPNNGYLFDTYNKEKNMVVDALLCGNESRFFNDVRGTHREANLIAVDVSFALGNVTVWTIVFTAARDIQVGEELLINYQADGEERYWEPPEVIDLTVEPVHFKREPVEAADEFEHTPSQESTDHRLKKRKRESEDDDDDNSNGEKPRAIEYHGRFLELAARLAQLHNYHNDVDEGLWQGLLLPFQGVVAECVASAVQRGDDQEDLFPLDLAPVYVPEGFKQCGRCHRVLQESERNFRRDKNRKSGFRARCKRCLSTKGTI